MKKITAKLAEKYEALKNKKENEACFKRKEEIKEKMANMIPEGETAETIKDEDLTPKQREELKKYNTELLELNKQIRIVNSTFHIATYELYSGKKYDGNTDLEEANRMVEKFRRVVQPFAGHYTGAK